MLQVKEEMKKEKRRLQEQLRRIKRNQVSLAKIVRIFLPPGRVADPIYFLKDPDLTVRKLGIRTQYVFIKST